MKLTEQHIVKYNIEMDDLCFKSKNLYNTCLYIIKQEFVSTKKYIGFKKLYYTIKKYPIWNDCMLPKKVTNQVVKQVHKDFTSFFKLNELYKNNKFKNKPKITKYKDSISGRNVIEYEKGCLSIKEFKNTGYIHLSKTNIKIKTQIKNWNDILHVRIIPNNKRFIVEVVYNKQENTPIINDNYASIDLGLNNLSTITFNDYSIPIIIKGTPLKSINQYYNKQKSIIQSILKTRNNKKHSNELYKLTNKRNNKIKDYLHKSSFKIVNQLVSQNISTLIIGKNRNWKQDINLGRKNNQNFVQIPFNNFINMLKYKCKLKGIKVIETEESYTSKCSFLDNEEIKKHDIYNGKRICRGLFKTSMGKIINSDVNGSYNIMKKAISKYSLKGMDGIEGFAVSPKVILL